MGPAISDRAWALHAFFLGPDRGCAGCNLKVPTWHGRSVMSGQRSNNSSPSLAVRASRRRIVALGASAGAFVAVGLSALATPPTARADDFGFGDWIADLFGHADEASVGPGDAVGDIGAPTAQAALATVDTADPAGGMLAAPADDWFQQLFYDPVHTAVEDWINSPFGAQVGGFINEISGQFLVGDG